MSQDTWVGRRHKNMGTVAAMPAMADPPLPALGPRPAFLVAYERLRLIATAAPESAVVVAAVDPRAQVIAALAVEDRGALVIGRHTECGIHLPAETTSLRHAIALVLRERHRDFDPGQPTVRLWDARTGVPFVTEDGERDEAVISDGPLYASIDRHALWFLPTAGPWPAQAEQAWESLPPREVIDRRAAGAPTPAPAPALRPPPKPRSPRTTGITRLAPPLFLAEGDAPEIAWGEVRIARDGHREKRLISAERLERGVLLGRYERCGLTLAGDNRISRVHLMLVRIGGDVWAIDTASTHGTTREGARLSACVLRDVDHLQLAEHTTVDWRRVVHPEA